MPEIALQVVLEIAKSSPYAAMRILFAWLLSRTHSKQTEQLKNTYDKSVDDLKEVYEKVYTKLEKREKSTK